MSSHQLTTTFALLFGVFIYPHVTSSKDTTIGRIVELLLGVAGGFGSITTARKKPKSTEL
jgi:hypothetical protein